MGRFDPYLEVYCQNDEVSTVVHTTMSRERVVRYPLGQHCCPIPHLTQRGIEFGRFSDILNEVVYT